MATFPATLPKPSYNGYQLAPEDQTVRTDMEVGAARTRRRTASRNDQVSLTWVFTDAEMAIFRAWHQNAVGWSFFYPHNTTGAASWGNTRSTDIANYGAAPDATVTATLLGADATLTNSHLVFKNQAGLQDDTKYTFSAYLKAVTKTWARLSIVNKAGADKVAYFDISTGVVGGTHSADGYGIESVGDGWFRCWVTVNLLTGGSTPQPRICIAEANNDITFDGTYLTATAQAGAASSITLNAGASATTNFYLGKLIEITSGTGAGQTATVTAYDGTTKVATVGVAWATAPDATSVFRILDGILCWGDNLTKSDDVLPFLPTLSTGEVDGAAGGAAWFTGLSLAIGDTGMTSEECRFSGAWAATPMPGLIWNVTAKLEVR